MRALRWWVVVLVAFCSPALAGVTGQLRGVVQDTQGEGIADARVWISSPVLQGGARTLVTDQDGFYRFSHLPPGQYSIIVEREGFVPRELRGVTVEIDRMDERELVLEGHAGPGPAARVVETLHDNGVDPRRVAPGRYLRPSVTDKVVTDRSATGMALLVPGVVEASGVAGNPSIRGGAPYANGYYLDGLWVNDPSTQLFTGRVNFDSIAETQVLTGGFDAEYGYLTGGLINVVTTSGQDTFDFDGSAYWAPYQLRLGDEDEVTQRNVLAGNLSASGPILPRRLWFHASLGYVDETATTPLEHPVFLETPFMQPRQLTAVSLLGKLTWRPLAWQSFGLILQGDPSWLTNERQEPLRHPRAERQIYEGGVKAGVYSETHLSDDIVWSTRFAYSLDRYEVLPVSNDVDLAGHYNLETGTSTINDSFRSDNFRSRLQLHSSVTTFVSDFVGRHEIKAGVQGQLAWNVIEQGLNGGELLLDRGFEGPGTDVSTVGDPYRTQRAENDLQKFVWGNQVSAYVQDVWNPFRSLTVRAGVRLDSARAYVDAADGGAVLYNFNWPSPRLGAVWDPFGDGKTAIRGGYYHYADMGNLSLPGRVGRSLALETYEYNPATGKYDIFVGREGGEAGVIPGDTLIPPLMHEFLLGASREVFDFASVHVDLVYRFKQNIFEDTETNVQWNADGSAATGFANGNPELVRNLSTPPQAFQRYLGLDLTFDKRLSDRWSLYATYTLSQLEGTVDDPVGYSFDNPRQAQYEFGFLKNDIRHNARLFLTYDLPYGLTVGVSAQYQSGRPYSKLFYNEVYDDYVDRRAPRGFDPRDLNDPNDDVELRLPDQFQVNARLVWRLKELTTQDIWLVVEVRNLLNQRPTSAVEERALAPEAAAFGQPIDRVEPLRGTLSLRYRF